MTADLILHECRRRGVSVRLVDGDLKLAGPLTDGLIACIGRRKAEIIDLLSRPVDPAYVITPDWAAISARREQSADDPTPGIAVETPIAGTVTIPASPEIEADAPKPLDFTDDDCPAFAFDDSLSVSAAQVRTAVEELKTYGRS